MKLPVRKFYFLRNDLVFKHIFGYQGNVEFITDLLEYFLDLKPGTIGKIRIINSVRLNQQIIKDKAFELDILVELENGDLINVEMYNNYDINAEKKSALYTAKVFGSLALRRSEKYDLLKMTRGISFVKGDKVHKNGKPINKFLIINEEDLNDRMLPDLFQMYIVDIDVKDKNNYNISENLRLWLDFINSESLEELEVLASKRDILRRALEEMKRFNEEEWIQDFNSRDLLIESQHDTALKNVKEETKEEVKLELAKNLLKKNVMSYEDIADTINLSIKDIKNLAKELNF